MGESDEQNEGKGGVMTHPQYERLEMLSTSESGLHYVRERRSGIVRQLTDDELRDFNDPPPCEECGEQFGCEHYNCAREPLMSEREIDEDVPAELRTFARDNGLSRADLLRLQSIHQVDGEYRLDPGAATDMRTLELMLLLNDYR